MTVTRHNLADIQSGTPAIAMSLDRVGVKGLVCRLALRDRAAGQQTVSATASLSVDLPADRRGTHMSRLVEALDSWHEELGCRSMRELLAGIRNRLDAGSAFARFDFAYLVRRQAPSSAVSASMAYDCWVSASLSGDDTLAFDLGVAVPVMTVCPCSLAIASTGAHCQRAIIRIGASIDHFVWLEEFIELAEAAGSAPVYPLLKREDEKFVTELAFSRPAFVEDVARAVAAAMRAKPHVHAFCVNVESMESIHNHDAFASVEFSG